VDDLLVADSAIFLTDKIGSVRLNIGSGFSNPEQIKLDLFRWAKGSDMD